MYVLQLFSPFFFFYKDEDVRWVITVPAIWRPAAKQLMRQAAYEAGIGSPLLPEQVLISLEPEAASIFCRQLKVICLYFLIRIVVTFLRFR